MAQLQVGDVLEGRYQIDHPIARGGMSTVYRCVDLRLGRAVAVKVMDDRYVDDPVFRQRFRREARAMARINHPHIVGVYDFGSDGHHVFLVMELITGGTLRELLAERGPMPPHAALSVMRAVLTGLAEAHRDGLIHRDIKPDNVLISADHAVKLADFGLVRATDSQQHTTTHIVGTAAYLSPEQVRGAELTPASDVYSAGIVLFELLTGETPFRGTTDLDRAYRRLDQDVPPPSEVIEGIPPEIDALVARATHRDPAHRYPDAAAFLDAAAQLIAGLRLPDFTVPLPQNSAAHRAAEIPTDTGSLPTAMMATGIITPPATEIEHSAPDQTALLPAEAPASLHTNPPHPAPPDSEAAEPPSSPPTPTGPRPYSNRSPLGLAAWLTIVGVFLTAVALGGWWLGSGRYGDIPEIIGMDKNQGLAALEDAGFEATAREVYDDETAQGHAVGTDPSGDRAIRGSQVAILVSQGRPTVPTIAPQTGAQRYEQLLAERTLSGRVSRREHSEDVPAGDVISVSPAPGTAVPTQSIVELTISKGPAPVPVPDLGGMNEDEAATALTKAGLKVGMVDWAYDAHRDYGAVSATVPDRGTEATRGDSVRLILSSARTVPEVSGLSVEEATARLAREGLRLGEVTEDPTLTGTRGEAQASKPQAGSRLDPKDSTVDLVLPGRVRSPFLLGKTVAQAEQTAREEGLDLDTGHASSPQARILTQSPLPGASLPLGSPVVVTALG
ncbi:Stk1 family PASTA domain-containing Ser/Thr kinase [Corynebacterium sp. zg-331]|uniref:Stk1 family PASTA domain-containing Ser/Thr kinase n=1 Tax=unclassified Corynebacterium TaxID=2624378 RepID=UPI00128CA3EB|nr:MULTISPECIES: Stk1 family PASTA domain-containing Ser/Thr kinase [unclassified Corynebacterium]MBC3185207.1 Stk1 family PASTA domain-containing Ser/Thr kinase [Corynebacterium sp. zg-331]MPV51705.1 Stk1 family PASTA domain-containing Ser/Thr kinase [Corynebacterium sp. zg331]